MLGISPEQIGQVIIDGLLVGGVYGAISVGLSLIFGTLNVVNFAQAEFTMIGMLTAWVVWSLTGLDPLLGSVVAFLVGFVLGALVERLLIQRVLHTSGISQIFLTVGLLLVLENSALMIFGSDFRSVLVPYQTEAYRLGPFFISAPYLYAFVAALLGSLAMQLLLAKSWIGRAIRATAQDKMAAQIVGINTKFIHMIAFGIGTGMTAFGGAVILPYSTVSPSVGSQYVVIMFLVVVLGGLGSISGALIGGLVAGIIQSFSGLLLPMQLQNLLLFVVFLAVLYLRPEGILGRGKL